MLRLMDPPWLRSGNQTLTSEWAELDWMLGW